MEPWGAQTPPKGISTSVTKRQEQQLSGSAHGGGVEGWGPAGVCPCSIPECTLTWRGRRQGWMVCQNLSPGWLPQPLPTPGETVHLRLGLEPTRPGLKPGQNPESSN